MKAPLSSSRWLTVGSIVAMQGLRGEVRVRSTTDFPELRFRKGEKLWLRPPLQGDFSLSLSEDPLDIEYARPHKTGYVVRFVGWNSIDSAEPYRGCQLVVPYEYKAPSVEGEYYYQDIVGCQVETVEGQPMGEVVDVQSSPAHDLWLVRDPENGQIWMLPYTDAFVKNVDIENKKIVMIWLEGLRG